MTGMSQENMKSRWQSHLLCQLWSCLLTVCRLLHRQSGTRQSLCLKGKSERCRQANKLPAHWVRQERKQRVRENRVKALNPALSAGDQEGEAGAR